MIGIDTNVLVRYLVNDEPDQFRKAARFIEHECSVENPGFINRIVLCELVWVLESAFGYSRDTVALALGKILRAAELKVEDTQEVWSSFNAYRAGADFADALIGGTNRRTGCKHTVTFDRKASRGPDFVPL